MGFTLRMPPQTYWGNDGQERLAAFAAPYRRVCVFTDAAVAGTPGAQKMLARFGTRARSLPCFPT